MFLLQAIIFSADTTDLHNNVRSVGSRTTTSAGTISSTRAVGEKPKAFPPGPSAGTLFLHEWEFENRLLPRAPCFSHDLAVLSSASVQIQCPCQDIVDLCISFDVILYIKFLHLEKHKIVFKLQAKIDSKKENIAKKRSFFDPLKTKCT